jgi:hypothetical protein
LNATETETKTTSVKKTRRTARSADTAVEETPAVS